MGGVHWGQSIDEASTAAFSMNVHVGADVEALSTISKFSSPGRQAGRQAPTQLRGTLCPPPPLLPVQPEGQARRAIGWENYRQGGRRSRGVRDQGEARAGGKGGPVISWTWNWLP